jgi:hypothetical protein
MKYIICMLCINKITLLQTPFQIFKTFVLHKIRLLLALRKLHYFLQCTKLCINIRLQYLSVIVAIRNLLCRKKTIVEQFLIGIMSEQKIMLKTTSICYNLKKQSDKNEFKIFHYIF